MLEENIHLKISSDDKQKLNLRAKELGLGLSSYIRLELKKSIAFRELILRDLISPCHIPNDDLP